jgi:hypothetical protein
MTPPYHWIDPMRTLHGGTKVDKVVRMWVSSLALECGLRTRTPTPLFRGVGLRALTR